ncbi:MAG: DUF2336 domain-containing protein [Bauldia sp.]|nr:DUF2336 domain-containing protein [Bauldia sp.]
MESALPTRRAEEAFALGRAYLHEDLRSGARDSMETAITLLLDDPSPMVRRALAEALAASPEAPRHAILTLAADRADIAALIVARSPVLLDGELVDLAATMIEPVQDAIAARPVLSTAVSAALTELGTLKACRTLVANPGAEVAKVSLHRLVDRWGDDAEIRDSLLSRADLPGEIRQSLVRSLSVALGNLVSMRAWLDRDRATTVTRDACDRATVAIAAETASDDLVPMAEHLRVTGQLTTSLLLRAVCAGNAAFFSAALAVLSRLPERRCRELVFDGKVAALRAVYGRAGLPPVAFDAFMAAIHICRQWRGTIADPQARLRLTRRLVEDVLARYVAITDSEMNELTAMLRRFAADAARAAARAIAAA